MDVGVARFLTTSDGQIVANPRFVAASAEVIAELQRRKERARPGSGNRKRITRALAREWRKVRNRRRDVHHKTARALVNECDVIALEGLHTAGMTRRPAPQPDPERPGAFLPKPGGGQGRADQEHPGCWLVPVHGHPRGQSGRGWPASRVRESGRDGHHLPPMRATMHPP